MRILATVLTLIALGVGAWAGYTFGLVEGLFIGLLAGLPGLTVWRRSIRQKTIRLGECGYLLVLIACAAGGTGIIVVSWYDAGMDADAKFLRNYRAFSREIAAKPEFQDVTLMRQPRSKSGLWIVMRGTVSDPAAYAWLMAKAEEYTITGTGGYVDGVRVRRTEEDRDARNEAETVEPPPTYTPPDFP